MVKPVYQVGFLRLHWIPTEAYPWNWNTGARSQKLERLVNDNTRKFGSQIYTAGQWYFAKEHFQISVMMHHSMFYQVPQKSPCHVVQYIKICDNSIFWHNWRNPEFCNFGFGNTPLESSTALIHLTNMNFIFLVIHSWFLISNLKTLQYFKNIFQKL